MCVCVSVCVCVGGGFRVAEGVRLWVLGEVQGQADMLVLPLLDLPLVGAARLLDRTKLDGA